MHRCLESEDVVIQIVRHLNDEAAYSDVRFYDRSIAASIAALSATCRLLYEPAMTGLWEEMCIEDLLQAVSYILATP